MISSANFFFLKVSFTAVKEKSTKSLRRGKKTAEVVFSAKLSLDC